MSDEAIPFGRPMIGTEEQAAVAAVLAGTQLVHGPRAKDFEERFAARIGARHAVTAGNCTAAMHLSLMALGVGPGDRVAVPAMTHVATAHVVEYVGATPVFVDCDPETGNMSLEGLRAAAAPGLRAIMPVHYLGLPLDMAALGAIAASCGAVVVEDCAVALDATFDGRKVGTFGATGCFSFYPTKHMTTLEGGMVVTSDDALAGALRQRRAFGYDQMLGERKRPGVYDVTVLGYNLRMNEAQAAIGLCQLAKLDSFQAARSANDAALRAELAEVDELTLFPAVRGPARSSHYCLNATLPRDGKPGRDVVVTALRDQGIGTSVHYPGPVPLMSYYRARYGHAPGAFPIAEWIAEQTISLPVGPHLAPGDPERIATAVKEAVRRARA